MKKNPKNNSLCRTRRRFASGGSIIEIVIALGIFVFIVSGLTTLYLASFDSNRRNITFLESDQYLQEAFEAVRSIRDNSFEALVNGNHGVTRVSGFWEFSGTSDVLGDFTRVVKVEDVLRGAQCEIVQEGGTADPKTKKITATVSWGASSAVSAVSYLADLKTQGGCGSSGALLITVGTPSLQGLGKRLLPDVPIQNTGDVPVSIATITPTWTNASLIQKVSIGGTWVWRENNEGSPDGEQPSGVQLDIQDYQIAAHGSAVFDIVEFKDDMTGATFTFLFGMTDGTSRYFEISL